MTDSFIIAGRQFRSRLIVGTGKYKSFQETARALEASGADMVTVAVRRVNLDRSKESLLDYIDLNKYFLLPNTAGCYTADDTIRTARLAREVGLSDWIKIEVIGDQATLYPDVQATLEATRVLAKEGFTVMAYTSDDIVFAKRLVDAGAAAVMPLGAPIGSGLGIQNTANLQILRELITGVPLIVDAGVGTGTGANGGSYEARSAGRTTSIPGRKNATKALCNREFATRRRCQIKEQTVILSEAKDLMLKNHRSFPSPGRHSVDVPCRFTVYALQHLDAVNVDLVAVDVSSYGNVMPVVILEGIGIVHRQDLLVAVGNDDCTGAGSDALFRACFSACISSLNSTLGIANPAVHGLGRTGKRHRGYR
jgi:thiazole synthase